MGDQFDELREEIKFAMPRRKIDSIVEEDGKVVVTFKTGGRAMDPQEERQIKMLAYRVMDKDANVKIV